MGPIWEELGPIWGWVPFSGILGPIWPKWVPYSAGRGSEFEKPAGALPIPPGRVPLALRYIASACH
jgi:hypothetical protein